jgi:hypothetical protein
MENWAEEINSIIDDKLKDARDKDLRFLRVAEFKRNIVRTGNYSDNCSFCKQQKILIAEAVSKIEKTVNEPGKSRREYDRLIYQTSKHMKKAHGFYPPYHFSYLYSFFGILVGLILGYFLMKTVPDYSTEMLSIGFTIGLIPAYIWGYIKDKKIRAEKRIM